MNPSRRSIRRCARRCCPWSPMSASSSQLTLLMVSHSVEDAARIAPRSMVVAEGRIVWDGATAELLSGHSSASHLMGISAR
ncbi:thiamin ABC transporter, ATPase component thiQ [Klebsiella pneumoniae]|nr:thiamin ABC transporter, ATPase component thiQ [Klebsiella pneumoniae]